MNTYIIKRFLLMALILCLLGGCATLPEEHHGAATGAGIGAATGALAGAMFADEGSRSQGALLGGLAGALVGGVIGNYTVDQKRDAADTSSRYDYDSSAGILVRIENTSISPNRVYPGDRVDLKATYAVLAPRRNTQIDITESREIRFNGELVGKPKIRTSHVPGTYDSNIPLYLARDAKRGTYQVITTIRTEDSSDARETSFTVR